MIRTPPWEIDAIVQDIRFLAHHYDFRFYHVPRNINKLAHCIVRDACCNHLPCNWVASPSASVKSALDRLF